MWVRDENRKTEIAWIQFPHFLSWYWLGLGGTREVLRRVGFSGMLLFPSLGPSSCINLGEHRNDMAELDHVLLHGIGFIGRFMLYI